MLAMGRSPMDCLATVHTVEVVVVSDLVSDLDLAEVLGQTLDTHTHRLHRMAGISCYPHNTELARCSDCSKVCL